jgi:hypothetical protein
MRFPVEVVKAVRKAVGNDFIIIFRLSMLDLVPEVGAVSRERREGLLSTEFWVCVCVGSRCNCDPPIHPRACLMMKLHQGLGVARDRGAGQGDRGGGRLHHQHGHRVARGCASVLSIDTWPPFQYTSLSNQTKPTNHSLNQSTQSLNDPARIPTIATCVPRAGFAWVTRKLKQEKVLSIPLCTTNRINMPGTAEAVLADGSAVSCVVLTCARHVCRVLGCVLSPPTRAYAYMYTCTHTHTYAHALETPPGPDLDGAALPGGPRILDQGAGGARGRDQHLHRL